MIALRPLLRPLMTPVLRGVFDASGASLTQLARAIVRKYGGAMYDPRILASLFQDANGASPITAFGQPAGLVLDTSYGLARGIELSTNPGGPFASAAGFVGTNTTLTITGDGYLRGTTVAAGGPNLSFSVPTVAGNTYQLVFAARRGTTPNGNQLRVGSSGIGSVNYLNNLNAFPVGTPSGTEQTFTVVFLALSTTAWVSFGYGETAIGQTFEVKSASVREIYGRPALQTTTTARPIYQGAPPQLVFDAIDDALVTNFPVALGPGGAIVRSIPGVGANISAGVNLGTTVTTTLTNSGLVIVGPGVVAADLAILGRWAAQRAVP